MKSSFHVRVLIDNCVQRGGLAAEHGWSVWIETSDGGILFDTGQTGLCLQNARILGVPMARTRHIVLSHGHYDHTGGLLAVWDVAPRARLLLHPAAILSKYVRDRDSSARYIGMPLACIDAVHSRMDRVVWTEGPVEIASGVFATGPIPRTTTGEDTGGPFFRDAACQVADPLMDDQAIYIRTSQGLVVLLGCAHAGVVNTLNWIEHLEPGVPVFTLLGGMHLGQASPDRLSSTLDALRRKSIAHLHPAHCTGWRWPMRSQALVNRALSVSNGSSQANSVTCRFDVQPACHVVEIHVATAVAKEDRLRKGAVPTIIGLFQSPWRQTSHSKPALPPLFS